MSDPEFYVGYVPRAPCGLASRMKQACIALLLMAAAVALVLVFSQQPFADSRFEWGQAREFAGVVRATPVPMLIGSQPYLLVGPGKHGVGGAVASLDGRSVRLRGSLIERGDQRAIEVLPDSIDAGSAAAPRGATTVLGPAELTGEIVDSKCYLGVMNPGSGKVHRDCAVRCLSGGVPPGFLVRDRHGRGRTLLLASESGEPLVPRILSHVAEPVRLAGTLESTDGVLTFRIRE
jgi:hypothetical protein